MEYRVGRKTFSVRITGGQAEPWEVSSTPVGGEGAEQRLSCRLTPVGGHAYSFEVGDKRYLAHAAEGPEGWYVSVGGQPTLVVPPELLERERRQGAQADAETHVTPPMPGQVIKILVTAGDRVEAGQPVVVISAMKMETSLAAPHAGVVTAINTEVGAQVMPGDILVDIEGT